MKEIVAKKEAEYLLEMLRESVTQYVTASVNKVSTDSLSITTPTLLDIAASITNVVDIFLPPNNSSHAVNSSRITNRLG